VNEITVGQWPQVLPLRIMKREIKTGEHAIVLGGSMAGLLAARALAPYFTNVTLVERDVLSEQAAKRKGVPQAQHTHALLAQGSIVLERYFPGLRSALIAEGVPTGDPGLSIRRITGGRRSAPCPTGRTGLYVSRPLLERHVRRLVLQLPNLVLCEGHSVAGLVAERRGERVTGARLQVCGDAGGERTLEGDLVVDATGRGSKTPAWLGDLGFAQPERESVRVGIGYVTRKFRRQPGDYAGDLGVVVSAVAPNRRAAAALAQEADHWSVTLVGYLGDPVPTEHGAFVDYARGLPTLDVHELLQHAEPIGDALRASYPASVRLRYERMRRFPAGYCVIGDALCGFNPIFGQGMAVAAIEATLLEATVRKGLQRVGRRFFAQTVKPLDAPWGIATGNDLRFTEVEGRRSWTRRALNAYMARFVRAAARDAVLSRAFLDVANLTTPPARLLAPNLVARVLLGASRPAGQVAVAAATSREVST
jgi:2-polyprenyl-6-methoxyphenol hydroxylase-like FAD-dependent oxidoreductase